MIDPLSFEIAAGTLTGDAVYGGPEKAVAAHLRANLPELSRFAQLVGQPIDGSASLTAVVTGTESRPALELDLSATGLRVGSSGAEHVEANVWATPKGVLDNPETQIDLAAKGRIAGLVTPEGVAVPPELGRDIDWSLAGTAARNGSTIDLIRLSAEGAGIAVGGSGRLAEGGA